MSVPYTNSLQEKREEMLQIYLNHKGEESVGDTNIKQLESCIARAEMLPINVLVTTRLQTVVTATDHTLVTRLYSSGSSATRAGAKP
jgi:hypothetical protein